MGRIVIDNVPTELHAMIKYLATLEGQTMRQYVLDRITPAPNDESLKAIEESWQGDFEYYDSVEDMMASIKEDD